MKKIPLWRRYARLLGSSLWASGVNAAVFSLVNTLLLRPLPFPNSERLVWFMGGKSIAAKMRAAAGLSGQTYTVDAYEEFKRNNYSFASVTAYQTFYSSIQYKLTGKGEPRELAAIKVADNFFSTLGVQPVLGRNFTGEECHKGGRPAVLLSYYFWKNQFAGDPAIAWAFCWPRSASRASSPNSVTQKTQEIGVRMALGATTGRVMRDVLMNTLRMTVAGIVLGTAGSLAAARLIASLLYSTSPWDAETFAGMVLALVVVALISGYFPARRASRVSPMTALRSI